MLLGVGMASDLLWLSVLQYRCNEERRDGLTLGDVRFGFSVRVFTMPQTLALGEQRGELFPPSRPGNMVEELTHGARPTISVMPPLSTCRPRSSRLSPDSPRHALERRSTSRKPGSRRLIGGPAFWRW